MSDNELDRLITERDPEDISDGERARRTSERIRWMAAMMIQIRDNKDRAIAALEARVKPLETQVMGWQAQLMLLVAQVGLAIALIGKMGGK